MILTRVSNVGIKLFATARRAVDSTFVAEADDFSYLYGRHKRV